MIRKYAFLLILAGHRYNKAGQVRAPHCYTAHAEAHRRHPFRDVDPPAGC